MVDRRTEAMLGRANDDAQWDALDGATDRLHELEDRLNNVFPTPDTPTGAAQRVRIGVPTPETVLTLGSRQSNTGRAIGPSGVALRTVQNLGVEIKGSTVIDTDGLTITHSLGAMRMLTQADLGIAAKTSIRMGTQEGNIEISAGEVEAPDPAFTVVPSRDVPEEAPEIGTEAPRERTIAIREAWETVWLGLETVLEFEYVFGAQHGGPPSVAPHAMRFLSSLSAAYGVMHSAISAAISAAVAASHREEGESEEPQVLVHGAGAVDISSPHEVKAFGKVAVEIASLNKAVMEAGLKAMVASPVYAAVFGGRMAKLKSEGVAMVSGHHAAVSGHTTDLVGHEAIALSSSDKVLVRSDGETVVQAKQEVAIGGHDVHASAERDVHVSAKHDVRIEGTKHVALIAGEDGAALKLADYGKASLTADDGQNEIELYSNEIRLKPGGAPQLVASRSEVKVCGQQIVARNGETTIRGPRINLG